MNNQKLYNIQYRIGKAKYVVNTYDGVGKHSDGSQFWGIELTNNKKILESIIKKLTKEGYKEA